MRFKIDENLPIDIAELLRSANHNAETVWDEELVGRPDESILEVCREEDRCLLTLDLDFANLRTYPPEDLTGLVVFRLRRQDKNHLIKAAERIIPLLKSQS